MKFTVSNKVHRFRYKGKRYHPGEIVELLEGENVPGFLIPVGVKETPVKLEPTVDFSYGALPARVESEKAPKAELSESLEELDGAPKSRRRSR